MEAGPGTELGPGGAAVEAGPGAELEPGGAAVEAWPGGAAEEAVGAVLEVGRESGVTLLQEEGHNNFYSFSMNKQVRNPCVYSRPGDQVWLP